MSVGGRQAALVVQAWLIFDLTGSPLQLGLLGFVRAIPALVLGLAGGVIADRLDMRRLMIASAGANAVIWVLVAVQVFFGDLAVWHILAASFVAGGVGAFEGPSRNAIFPHLLDRSEMTRAVALNSAVDPGVRIFAPIVAGLIIDRIGSGYTGPAVALYGVAALYMLASLMMVLVHMPVIKRSVAGGIQSLVEGYQFLTTHRTLGFLIIMAFVHAFFGMAYSTLLPVFATEFAPDSSGSALGLFFAMAGLGGIIGAVVGGSLAQGVRVGPVIIASGVAFGGLLIAFAVTPWYWLALPLLVMVSMANNLFAVAAQSVLHARVPDEYRGRVMGFWGMQFSVLHQMGNLEIGLLAAGTDAGSAILMNGAVVVAFAIFAAGTNSSVRHLGRRETVERLTGG